MRYLISEVNEPLTYASSGMLIHSDQFLHPRRCIDTYVLLLIQKGTLCITMDYALLHEPFKDTAL